jgi:steroid delta-isomerase-like uncharacterized protein
MGFDNAQIARRFLEEIWGGGKVEAVDELVDPEIEVRDTMGTNIKGIDKVKELLEKLQTIFSDMVFTIEDVIVAGDRVVVRYTSTATHRGDFFGAPGTGRKVTNRACEVFRIANGKVVENIGYMDLYALLEQVGRVAPRDQLK